MRSEMRRSLFSAGTILSCCIVLICMFGFSIPVWLSTDGSALDYRASALELSLGGIFFGGLMLMLPFCAALPGTISQVDEVRSGFLYLRGIRESARYYVLTRTVSAMLAGAVSLALPFMIHCLLWNFIALPYDPVSYPDQEIIFHHLYNDWSRIAYAVPMYAWIALGLALTGALWALISLATAIWIPDKLVAVMVPIGICYFWSYGLFGHLLGMTLPSPSGIYNDGLSWSRCFQTLAMYAVFGTIALAVYYSGLKRRLRNA